MNKIATIYITKNELTLILESLNENDTYIKPHQKIKLSILRNKFKKLSPYFEYKLEPIMYDIF